MPNTKKDVGIIGGGFTGYAVLLNILDRAIEGANDPNHPIYDITVYNPNDETRAGGIAYGQAGAEHKTNSWVFQMSPFAHKPDDMIEWLEANRGLANIIRPELRPFDLDQLGPNTPFPRPLYKIYLQDRRDELIEKAVKAGVLYNIDEKNTLVTGLHRDHADGWDTDIATNPDHHPHHDVVVLAQGHIEGNKPHFLEGMPPACAALCTENVWDNLHNIRGMMHDPTITEIAVIGSGLTANDVVVTAHREGFFDRPDTKIYLISRNGHMHGTDDEPNPPMPEIKREDIPAPPHDIGDVPDYVAGIYRHYTDQGFAPWTIERKMRPFVPGMIAESGINPADLVGLMKRHSALIATTVAGVGTEIYTTVQQHINSGRVEIVKAQVTGIMPDPDRADQGVVIDLIDSKTSERQQLKASRLLNAAGFSSDYRTSQDPLTRQMVADGIVTTEPRTKLGIAVDAHQHPINRDGAIAPDLYLAGPLTTGHAALQGRVGAFALNVTGLRGDITAIADDLTGITPAMIPARQILPSGPETQKAKLNLAELDPHQAENKCVMTQAILRYKNKRKKRKEPDLTLTH